MSCAEIVGHMPIPLYVEIQDTNLSLVKMAKYAHHKPLEGYLIRGENYRVGNDTTHHFATRLKTITGRPIIPDPHDRIVTILARVIPDQTQTRIKCAWVLRLPTTVFNDVKTDAVFLFDNRLIRLKLCQEKCPDQSLQGRFDEVLKRFWFEVNTESQRGFGSCEYENISDVPANVRSIGTRVLSSDAKIYDCLKKEWITLTDENLKEIREQYNQALPLHEEAHVEELDLDCFTEAQELKWKLPPGNYQYLRCVVDEGMVLLVGKVENPAEGNGCFAFTKFSYKKALHTFGTIDKASFQTKLIKKGVITDKIGIVTDLVQDTLHIQYNRKPLTYAVA